MKNLKETDFGRVLESNEKCLVIRSWTCEETRNEGFNVLLGLYPRKELKMSKDDVKRIYKKFIEREKGSIEIELWDGFKGQLGYGDDLFFKMRYETDYTEEGLFIKTLYHISEDSNHKLKEVELVI